MQIDSVSWTSPPRKGCTACGTGGNSSLHTYGDGGGEVQQPPLEVRT